MSLQSNMRQDGEFRGRVVTVDVSRWIRFRETESLRLFESSRKGDRSDFHAAQDVIAGAVQDSGDADQTIAGESFLKRQQHGNATCNRSAEEELRAMIVSELGEFASAMR